MAYSGTATFLSGGTAGPVTVWVGSAGFITAVSGGVMSDLGEASKLGIEVASGGGSVNTSTGLALSLTIAGLSPNVPAGVIAGAIVGSQIGGDPCAK